MSDNSERPDAEVPSSIPAASSVPPADGNGDTTEAKPESQPSDHVAQAGGQNPGQAHDPREELKRGLERYRLTAEEKAQILADMPPPEEMERMYRELIEKGGLTFEEWFEPLMAEFAGHLQASTT